ALLVRTEGDAEPLVGAVLREIQSTSAELPYPSVDPMPRLFTQQVRPWRLGSLLLSLFAALGLLLGGVGLYGVLSYVVSQRTQEMGIRIALGAGRREIVELVMGQALRITGWGVVLGVAGALAMGRAIASLLYGVTPHDPLVLFLVIVILAAVAAVASYLPARLVFVWHRIATDGMRRARISAPDVAEFRAQATLFEAFAFTNNVRDVALTAGDLTDHARLGIVSSNFFSVLGARALVGRTFL